MGMSLKQIRYLYAIGVFKKDPKASLSRSREMTGTNRQTIREIGKMSTKLAIGETSSTHQLRIGDKTYPLKRDKNGSVYPVIGGKLVGSSQLPEGKMSIERVSKLGAKKQSKKSDKTDSSTNTFQSDTKEEFDKKIRESSPLHEFVSEQFRLEHFNGKMSKTIANFAEEFVQYPSGDEKNLSEVERRRLITGRFTEGDRLFGEMISKTEVLTRTSLQGLSSLLDHGKFKTIHDNVKSSTDVHKDDRKEYEERIFNGAAPVYGYLGYSDGNYEREGAVEHYGDVRITFKPSVRERSTFTSDDSLDGTQGGNNPRIIPGKLTQPKLADQADTTIGQVFGGKPEFKDVWSESHGGYFEAQLHGTTTTSDIQRVEFLGQTAPSTTLLAKLDKIGIPYKISRQKKRRVENDWGLEL